MRKTLKRRARKNRTRKGGVNESAIKPPNNNGRNKNQPVESISRPEIKLIDPNIRNHRETFNKNAFKFLQWHAARGVLPRNVVGFKPNKKPQVESTPRPEINVNKGPNTRNARRTFHPAALAHYQKMARQNVLPNVAGFKP